MKVTNRLFYSLIIIAIIAALGACQTEEKAGVEKETGDTAGASGINPDGAVTKAAPETDLDLDLVLAEFDGGTVTVRDIKQVKRNKSIYPTCMTPYGSLSSDEQSRKLVELITYHRLAAATPKAEALFAADEKMQDTIEGMRSNFLLKNYYTKNVVDKIEVPEAEIKEYYDANKENYYLEPSVTARYIFIEARETDSKEKHAEAMERIEKVEKLLKEGNDFVEMVKAYSEAASKDSGGLIGKVTKDSPYNPDLVKAVMELEEGEISTIINIRHGYYIFKADERSGGDYRPLEIVESSIRGKLKRVKMNDAFPVLIKNLSEKYNASRSEDFDAFFAGSDESELYRIGDETYTLADLKKDAPHITDMEASPERDKRLNDFLQKEYDFQLIEMAAVDNGEDKDPDFIASYNTNRENFITNAIVQKARNESIQVTDQDLMDYYEEYKNTAFKGQDSWKLREIKKKLEFPQDSTMRDRYDVIVALKKEMSEIRRKIISGEADFADMARKHSDAPSKENGGDLGWQEGLGKFSIPETKAINTLEAGQISEPLTIGDSHISIIQFLERKSGKIKPFDEVKEICRANAIAKKTTSWKEKHMEETLKKANAKVLDFDPEILK